MHRYDELRDVLREAPLDDFEQPVVLVAGVVALTSFLLWPGPRLLGRVDVDLFVRVADA
ncbi:MAG TPA: hypothetical protein VI386_37180 [Candidatus Sulfotelmatobacter sp.]